MVIQVRPATEEQLIPHHRRRGVEAVIQFVAGEDLDRFRVLEHDRGAVLPGQVQCGYCTPMGEA